MFKVFELTSTYISTRRKASTIQLNSVELEEYIRKIIFILELNGEKYFNFSKVLTELYETQGFPDRKNKQELRLFTDAFSRVSILYEKHPSHINNFSFKLKVDPNAYTFTFKRLV